MRNTKYREEILIFSWCLVSILVVLSLIFVAFRVPAVQATTFDSTSFKVLDPIIHIFGGLSTSSGFRQYEAGSQPAIGISTSSSFILKGGFLYFPGVPTPSPTPTVSPTLPPAGGGGGLGGPPLAIPRVFPREIDFNKDGRVDLVDASIMLHWWEKRIAAREVAAVLALNQFPPDPNGDSFVNIFDLSILLFYWTG